MEKNEKINLNKPEYFFNRELSWLKFNLRVLRSRRKNHAAFGTLEICCHYRV